jgi:WD40 repeat protein/serine/threonine protein kinase
MAGDRIILKINPTPASQNISEEDLEKLCRIIKMPPAMVKERISIGKGVKISISNQAGVNKLISVIKSFGFAVVSSETDPEAAKETKPGQPPEPAGQKPPAGRKEVTEWKAGDVIEGLYAVRDIRFGGMGAVYVVRHLQWNTMLAVKSLYHRLRGSEEEMALFVKEAETWIDIGFHPNIAACYYVRNILGAPRIFIEYADGGALNEWFAQNRHAGWDAVIDILVQVSDGLQHAHTKGLVHRDVKPGNCMRTQGGIVKVTDFGLTKRRKRGENGSTTGTISPDAVAQADQTPTAAGMGTPGYMAPEMWITNAEVGPTADIYALGVMAFEVCCGRKPFLARKGEKLNRLALAHLQQPPPKPRSLRADMPGQIEAIILKCLNKKPKDRYASCLELRDDLAAAHEALFKTPYSRERPDELKLLGDALNNRAISLLDLNHHQEALSALKRALELDPHHPEATFNLALMEWQRTGDPDRDLIMQMEDLVKTPEYTGRGGHLLGRSLLALGDAEGALKACELSLSAPDANEEWLKPYAVALIGLGRRSEAIGHLKTYLADYPSNEEAEGWLIGALVREKRVKEARGRHAILPEGSALARLSLEQIADAFVFSGLGQALNLKGHSGWVNCVACFPHSARVLTGARDRTVKIWDLSTGEEQKSFPVLGEPPAVLAISPDEKTTAVAGGKAGLPVHILDLETGRVIGRLTSQEKFSFVDFAPDGKHILTIEEKGAVRLWDTGQFKAASTFRIPSHSAAGAVFGKDASIKVFIGGMDRVLKSIVVGNAEAFNFERGHNDIITMIRVASDGRRLVTAGKDKLLIVWDSTTGKTLRVFEGHKDHVADVAFNPQRDLVAGYDPKAGIKVWNCLSGRVIRTLNSGDSITQCLTFTPGGGCLLAGARDMVVRVWDVRGRSTWPEPALAKIQSVKKQMRSDKEFRALLEAAGKAMKRGTLSVAYALVRKAQTLAGYERSDEAFAMIHRMQEYGQRIGLRGGWNRKSIQSPAGVMDVRFSPSAISFLTAHSDHNVRLWSAKTGECLKVIGGHRNVVGCLCFSINGREVVSGGDDRAVRAWDLNTGRNLAVFQGHTDNVTSVAYSSDGKTVISGSWDGTVRQWRLSDGALVRTLKVQDAKIDAVDFLGDGKLIISAGFDGVLRMWETASGRLLREMKGHKDRITSVDVSPGEEYLITGSSDGTARLWDAKKGTAIKALGVSESVVRTVAFSPDGRFALTGGNDAMLRIWDLKKGECVRDFRGHAREITAAEFASNGRTMISSSSDGTVIIWELDWEWEFAGTKRDS